MKPKCEECPFNGRPKVEGMGVVHSDNVMLRDDEGPFDIAAVGMAPADEELRRKMVLVGPSGQFLHKTLRQLGLKKYWCCNVLLCPIYSDDEDDTIKEAVACCKERLLEELNDKRAKLTIALGDLPLHTLFQTKYSIKEIEGRVLPGESGALLPVSHPAFYLRRPEEAYDFIECMRAGARILEGRYEQAHDATFTVVSGDNLASVREALMKFEYLSLDAETTGFDAQTLHPDKILEVGLSGDSHHSYIIPYEYITKFKDIIETKKIIGWNIQFDASFLMVMGIKPNIYFDGMLAHYAMDERPHSHGLKRVARIYLGSEDWEEGLEQYLPNKRTSSYEYIPTDIRHQYLAYDTTRTFQLWKIQEEEVRDSWVFWNILMPATRMFTEVRNRGIRINPYKMVDMYHLLTQDLEDFREEMCKIVGREWNPSSYIDAKQVLFGDYGIPPHPQWGESTNKHVLEAYRDQFEIVDKLIEYREFAHDLGNYVKGFARYIDSNFCVHPVFLLFGTVTGRIATKNPSVMNIKEKSRVKEIFIPLVDGHSLAELDWKGIELRWYYMYSKDEQIKDIMVNGFKESYGFNLTEEQRKDPHYVIGLVTFRDALAAKEKRVVTKSLVFGRLYGRGIGSFLAGGGRVRAGQAELGIDEASVYSLVHIIDDMFPKLKQYARERANEATTRGYVESYFGRQRRFPLVVQKNRAEVERMARNMPIQSAASDLNLLCMLHLWKNKSKYGIWPIWPIHDSMILDVENPEVIPQIKKEVEQVALEIVEGQIPFVIEAEYGPSWGETKKI